MADIDGKLSDNETVKDEIQLWAKQKQELISFTVNILFHQTLLFCFESIDQFLLLFNDKDKLLQNLIFFNQTDTDLLTKFFLKRNL